MAIGSAILDRIITRFGSWVNINIGSESINSYGDGSYFFTAFSGEGYIRAADNNDNSIRAGVLEIGDAVGYFRMNAVFPLGSKIEITHQGINYETMGEQTIPHYSGNQLVKIVNLRRKVN